ncbi:MAG: cation:proton antiporter [Opitutaceae bacterium]|nr:cation:proton antiporter [Opitutaceae bacterium]
MHAITFLQDLAVVMMVAALVTVFCHRFRQPVVLGYIIAGVIIGPHTPPFPLIKDEASINTLSDLGVILLMFSLGLEFNLRKLKRLGVTPLIVALLECLLMFWAGYEIGRLFSWPTMDCLFLGAMLSMSSTTVIIKVLADLGMMKERGSHFIFGTLLLEDIFGVAMIALLSGIAMTGGLSLGEVGATVGKLGIFVVVSLVFGLITVPRLIGYVASFKSNEMLIITVLGLCFGVSLLAAKLGYSVALGAFVIGAVIAEAREIHRIEDLVGPVRDMFSAVFFVAIGLLIDPKMLITHWQPVLLITLAVVVGKVLACSFGAFAGGNDTRTSLRVGMGLAQIGEFSFIIASLGVTLNVTSSFLYPIAVAVSVITTFLTPYMIKSADGVADQFDRLAPRALVNTLALYTRWVGQIGGPSPNQVARSFLWKCAGQMALNAALIAAAFFGAAFVGQRPPGWVVNLGLSEPWLNVVLWLTAMILSLPVCVAMMRNLEAFGLLLAEIKVPRSAAGENTAAIRAIVAGVVPLAGTVALGLFVLVMSSTLLPSWNILIVLLLIVAAVTGLLWHGLLKIYSMGQVALQETFTEEPPPPAKEASDLLAQMPKEVELDTVMIAARTPAHGKLIRELALRTETGASIVSIERAGVSLVNPGPDEELLEGDRTVLLGTKDQLGRARRHLLGPV